MCPFQSDVWIRAVSESCLDQVCKRTSHRELSSSHQGRSAVTDPMSSPGEAEDLRCQKEDAPSPVRESHSSLPNQIKVTGLSHLYSTGTPAMDPQRLWHLGARHGNLGCSRSVWPVCARVPHTGRHTARRPPIENCSGFLNQGTICVRLQVQVD